MRLLASALLALALLPAAAARADTRSEVRHYVAAVHPLVVAQPGAIVAARAELVARRERVAATCPDLLRRAAANEIRAIDLSFAYFLEGYDPLVDVLVPLETAADARLAAIPTHSRLLRRARAARRRLTAILAALNSKFPDFCGTVGAWRAGGYKGDMIDNEVSRKLKSVERDDALLVRAAHFLRRHGASLHDAVAFYPANDTWLVALDPQTKRRDPVVALITPQPARRAARR
jgi:hypothetical protein